MQTELTNLKESKAFLNLVLNNIDAAILIVDEHFHIHKFNKSFLDLFDQALDCIVDRSFGQVAGCVNAVRENKGCGETSKCRCCNLKQSLLQTLPEDFQGAKKRLERVFYINGSPVSKYLEFTSQPIRFKGRKMMLVIINDITEIEKQRRELEGKQAQIELDLEAAANLQKSLLPRKGINITNMDSAWRFEPSHKVGGDLFQIYRDSDNQVSMYTLDVCGHGIHAAFVAVTVSQFLLSLHNRMRLTGRLFTPEKVMSRLDKAFPMDRFDCFFSIAYATLDVQTGSLVYSNAGHMPPLILRSDGKLDILQQHDTVIGAGFDWSFGQNEEKLGIGDRFVLYTDGLVENFGPDGERYGKYKFYTALKQMHRLPLDDLVKSIFEHSHTLRGVSSPTDDMSLVAIEYLPG